MLGLHRHSLDDMLTIIFSSGSTGEPKGVMLTHRNVGRNADSAIQHHRHRQCDRLLGMLPFFHSFGYTVCLWAPLRGRMRGRATTPTRGRRRRSASCAATHRVHGHAGDRDVPALLPAPVRRRTTSARCAILICGAEKLPPKLPGRVPRRSSACCRSKATAARSCRRSSRPTCPTSAIGGVAQDLQQAAARSASRSPACACRRSRPETRASRCRSATEGVLCVKGPNVMAGYLHQPEMTARGRSATAGTSPATWGGSTPDGFITHHRPAVAVRQDRRRDGAAGDGSRRRCTRCSRRRRPRAGGGGGAGREARRAAGRAVPAGGRGAACRSCSRRCRSAASRTCGCRTAATASRSRRCPCSAAASST